MNINTFFLSGVLYKEPQSAQTSNGEQSTSFQLSQSFKDKAGKRQYHNYWIRSYGKQAENDQKYLKKGSIVSVQGSLIPWYNPNTKENGFYLNAEKVQYLGEIGNKGGQEDQGATDEQAQASPVDQEWVNAYDQAPEAGQPQFAPKQRTQ